MSLVDYASSDDDVSDSEHQPPPKQRRQESPPAPPPQRPPCPPKTSKSGPSAYRKPQTLEKLPDASMLLNFPTASLTSGSDHASVVAAAMADNLSRKRDSGLSNRAPPLPRAKLPRANIPHSKNVPDSGGGTLVPPQLRGRSNVVTEDINKLFVNRHAVALPKGPENSIDSNIETISCTSKNNDVNAKFS